MSNNKNSNLVLIATITVASLASIYYLWNSKKEKKSESRILDLPIIDFNIFLNRNKDKDSYRKECLKVADALHNYG